VKEARLMIAASEQDADMLYLSGVFVPDPFIAIEIDGVWHGLFSALEVDRARKESSFGEVHLDTPWRQKVKAMGFESGLTSIAALFLQEHGVKRLTVPGQFPLAYAEQLRQHGLKVAPADGAMFPQRLIKSETEVAKLTQSEKLTVQAMRQAERFLHECRIESDGTLRHQDFGGRIGSKHLRSVIDSFLIRHGAIPSHTIVACGRQGADPHNTGHGILKSGQPIIIDIFPRMMKTGYWGDMTRTYVKGKATAEVKAMYRAVRDAQDIGLSMIADGVEGNEIHLAITRHFDASGFKTGTVRGKQCGFFHGTGHGVGLEIHESPRISTSSDILRSGQVVTVEPGLYYPKIGGIRLEDLVVVRQKGCDNLTRHRRKLEIE